MYREALIPNFLPTVYSKLCTITTARLTYFVVCYAEAGLFGWVELNELKPSHHHHHLPEGLGMLSCSLILKMKLVPPSLPQSSYVSSSFWFIL